jgi:hypothetical protein
LFPLPFLTPKGCEIFDRNDEKLQMLEHDYKAVLPPCQNVVHICFFKRQTVQSLTIYVEKYIKIVGHTFGIVDIDNFLTKLGQTLHRLTFIKNYMHLWQGGFANLCSFAYHMLAPNFVNAHLIVFNHSGLFFK